jgi:hypothetical protein
MLTAVIFSAPLAAVAANGQSDGGYVAPELSKPTLGQLLDEDYLTSTGETVARPGVPQSSGETPFDRSAPYASRMTASTTASARVVDGGCVFGGEMVVSMNKGDMAPRHTRLDLLVEMELLTEGGNFAEPRVASRCGFTTFREARSPLIIRR